MQLIQQSIDRLQRVFNRFGPLATGLLVGVVSGVILTAGMRWGSAPEEGEPENGAGQAPPSLRALGLPHEGRPGAGPGNRPFGLLARLETEPLGGGGFGRGRYPAARPYDRRADGAFHSVQSFATPGHGADYGGAPDYRGVIEAPIPYGAWSGEQGYSAPGYGGYPAPAGGWPQDAYSGGHLPDGYPYDRRQTPYGYQEMEPVYAPPAVGGIGGGRGGSGRDSRNYGPQSGPQTGWYREGTGDYHGYGTGSGDAAGFAEASPWGEMGGESDGVYAPSSGPGGWGRNGRRRPASVYGRDAVVRSRRLQAASNGAGNERGTGHPGYGSMPVYGPRAGGVYTGYAYEVYEGGPVYAPDETAEARARMRAQKKELERRRRDSHPYGNRDMEGPRDLLDERYAYPSARPGLEGGYHGHGLGPGYDNGYGYGPGYGNGYGGGYSDLWAGYPSLDGYNAPYPGAGGQGALLYGDPYGYSDRYGLSGYGSGYGFDPYGASPYGGAGTGLW